MEEVDKQLRRAMERGYQVPAIYVNRFLITPQLSGFRLSFWEDNTDNTLNAPGTAIFVSPQVAEELRDILGRMIGGGDGKDAAE